MIRLETMATPQMAGPKLTESGAAVVVHELTLVLGRRLTAFIAGAKSTNDVERASANQTLSLEAQSRLRTALEIVRLLSSREPKDVVQAWFMGLNPVLRDSPILILAQKDPATTREPLVRASMAFLAKA